MSITNSAISSESSHDRWKSPTLFWKKSNDGAQESDIRTNSRRMIQLMRMCCVDTSFRHQNLRCKCLACVKFRIVCIVCYAYVFALRLTLAISVIEKYWTVLSEAFCLGIMVLFLTTWLSMQAKSRKIIDISNRIDEIFGQNDFPGSRCYLIKVMFFATLFYLISITGIQFDYCLRFTDFVSVYYCFNVQDCPRTLSVFAVVIGFGLEIYVLSIVPTFLTLVYCVLADDVYCMMMGLKMMCSDIGKISDGKVYIMFNMHKRMLNVVQEMRDTFSTILIIFFMINYLHLFVSISQMILNPEYSARNPEHAFYMAISGIYNVFTMLGIIVISSKITLAQRQVRESFIDIYEHHVVTRHGKDDTSNFSQLLKAIVNREIIHMTAADMFNIGKSSILTYAGTIVTYAVLIITQVQKPRSDGARYGEADIVNASTSFYSMTV